MLSPDQQVLRTLDSKHRFWKIYQTCPDIRDIHSCEHMTPDILHSLSKIIEIIRQYCAFQMPCFMAMHCKLWLHQVILSRS